MPTKNALIASVQSVEAVDVFFNHKGRKLRLPNALEISMHGNTAYLQCNLKREDIYSNAKGDALTKTRGLVSQDTWEAFNPPPKEIQLASSKVSSVDVPKGYQWEVVNGLPRLVPSGAKAGARKSRTNLGPNKDAYPIGMQVRKMTKAGRTEATGKVSGYTAQGYRVKIGGETVTIKQFGRYWKAG